MTSSRPLSDSGQNSILNQVWLTPCSIFVLLNLLHDLDPTFFFSPTIPLLRKPPCSRHAVVLVVSRACPHMHGAAALPGTDHSPLSLLALEDPLFPQGPSQTLLPPPRSLLWCPHLLAIWLSHMLSCIFSHIAVPVA